ncbi:MAG: CBS domain-containing protein [Pirellulaceae bacterium]
MRPDPVAMTPNEMSLMVGDLMSRHDIDWLPVVESKEDRRLIGIVRSEKMLRWLVEQSESDAG